MRFSRYHVTGLCRKRQHRATPGSRRKEHRATPATPPVPPQLLAGHTCARYHNSPSVSICPRAIRAVKTGKRAQRRGAPTHRATCARAYRCVYRTTALRRAVSLRVTFVGCYAFSRKRFLGERGIHTFGASRLPRNLPSAAATAFNPSNEQTVVLDDCALPSVSSCWLQRVGNNMIV